MNDVFLTGGTGYMGGRLVPALLARGHRVHVLARAGSAGRIAPGAQPVIGSALDADSFAASVPAAATFVQLVGTPHPGPGKEAEFVRVDLAAARAGVEAARRARARHFVYVSVAQPAPVMRAYVDARAEGERAIREAGLAATILRPWYVLGPGHW
ncbi:MAG TPA: NAD(P)H-binding protein, partial [Gemmatimonadaceae bacterium]|nr:NAD(P)H-binding protein [Gemmatimonadaceae bacterium]